MVILKQWKLYLYIHHKVILRCKCIHFLLYWQHIPYEKKTLLNHKLTMVFEVKLWYKKVSLSTLKPWLIFLKGSYDALSSFPSSLEFYKLFVRR